MNGSFPFQDIYTRKNIPDKRSFAPFYAALMYSDKRILLFFAIFATWS